MSRTPQGSRVDRSRSATSSSPAAATDPADDRGWARWPQLLPILGALLVATFVAYWPVKDNGFIHLDDYDYVSRNQVVLKGLTADGLKWAFSTFAIANWHPLTWLSHMLDCDLFRGRTADGADQWPGGHHLMSVGLHAANSILVFLLFVRMTGARWRSALLAALFALHPVHVESVAWVAERKDVLSTLFGLLALLAYVSYARRSGGWRYAAVLTCFALSLLSKPMLVTLPFVMLLLDYWPLRRWAAEAPGGAASIRGLLLEKVPLIALSAASSVVTVLAQRSGGAIVQLARIGLMDRLANAAVAYGRYLLKTVWPAGLALQYPHPIRWPAETVLVAAAGVLAITALALLTMKRWRFLFVGWFWFLGTLIPVIGLVQVGAQSMADRYSYVPSIGLFVMIVWGATALAPARASLRAGLAVAAAAAVIALGAATHARARLWRDTETILRDALSKAPDNPYLEFLLGLSLQERGALGPAIPYLDQFFEMAPDNPPLLVRYAEAMGAVGRFRKAAQLFHRAWTLDPSSFPPSSMSNYALLLAASADDSVRDGRRAVELATKAVELSPPTNSSALYVLAAAYAEAGDFTRAAETAQRAVDLARSTGQDAFARTIEPQVAKFRSGKPSRDIVDRESS
jgi:protein O-mannosyl-transferase